VSGYRKYSGKRRSGKRRKHVALWTFVIFLVVVAGVAAGYYLWLHGIVSAANNRVSQDVREALAEHPTTTMGSVTTVAEAGPTTTTEAAPDSPDAMNILLVGCDKHGLSASSYGRSDTIMLVHVDPANNNLSTISFPRDLRVDVKGYGKQKLNAAFAYGGPALSIRTIQDITGIDINHYLEVDFKAFSDMVDKLGGVYVEVDRRYFFDGYGWEPLDLQPGYQLLNGADALDFCRYRHDSNLDFGRMERQQRFLTALRQQAGGWDLGLKLPSLISTFFEYATTDMGTNDFIKLAWWGIRLDTARMRQVTLRGGTQTIAGASYVICTKSEIADAVKTFLAVPGTESAGSSGGTGSVTSSTAADGAGSAGATNPGTILSASIWKGVAGKVSFAVQAPGYLPGRFTMSKRSPNNARIYKIKVGEGSQPALVMLYKLSGAEQYINITETTWVDAPAAMAGKEVTHNGTTFTVVMTADKVERVWWKSDGVLYWVANTLSHLATEDELLGIAESMVGVSAQ
jgi:polyisoprenyl-teichoic acid--peptidoglycan teichoic acid transferase